MAHTKVTVAKGLARVTGWIVGKWRGLHWAEGRRSVEGMERGLHLGLRDEEMTGIPTLPIQLVSKKKKTTILGRMKR